MVVDARELHQGLVVGRDFTNWIKERIRKYEFIELYGFRQFWGKPLGWSI